MHDTAIVDGGLGVAPTRRLLEFAAHLRRLHLRRAALGAAGRSLLLVAGPSILIAWLVPVARWPLAIALASFALAAALLAALRTRAVRDEALLRMVDDSGPAAASLEVVGDELATWLECHRRASTEIPMVRWLGDDVAAKLPALPPGVLANLGRSGLGRRRWLLPVVILLLLAWLLTEWLAPPWPGVLGGRATTNVPGSGNGGSGGQGSGGGDAPANEPSPEERPAERPPESPRDPLPQPPPSPPPSNPEPPPAEPPAPLLDIPAQQRFIVPEFVGDGPTRRVRMHAAELEQAGAAPAVAATSSGDGGALPPPPRSREEFERAAEAALRSRHVPDEERPMVRRFFELLRQAAR